MYPFLSFDQVLLDVPVRTQTRQKNGDETVGKYRILNGSHMSWPDPPRDAKTLGMYYGKCGSMHYALVPKCRD